MSDDLISASCPVCSKPVYASEGYYSHTGAHASCSRPIDTKPFDISSLDIGLKGTSKAIAKAKAPRKPIGEGSTSRKLIAMIEKEAKAFFCTDNIRHVQLYLPSPVWRQKRFDVVLVEGSLQSDGLTIFFRSWSGVTALVKGKSLEFEGEGGCSYYLKTKNPA